MKSKAPRFLNASRLFYIHLTLFIGGVLLYWYAYVQEIIYPGNALSPIERWQQNGITRINFSLTWALIILIHFAIVSAYNWRKQRQINEAESYIRWEENNTESERSVDRLEDEVKDSSVDLTEWHTNQHMLKQESQ